MHGPRVPRAARVVDPGGEAPLELVAIEAAGQRAQRARARTTAAPARSSAAASDAGVASGNTAPPSPSRMRVGGAALRERDHGPAGGQRLDRDDAEVVDGGMDDGVARARTGDRARRRRRGRAARRWAAPGAPGDRGPARRRRRPGGRAGPPSRAPPARRACTGPAPTRTGRSARRPRRARRIGDAREAPRVDRRLDDDRVATVVALDARLGVRAVRGQRDGAVGDRDVPAPQVPRDAARTPPVRARRPARASCSRPRPPRRSASANARTRRTARRPRGRAPFATAWLLEITRS